MDNAQSWAIRLMHERVEHDLAVFLTFTYNKESLPNPPTLIKRHMQLFFKKLRKMIWQEYPDNPKIKYFMCGEYGGQTNRPHYHAIVYGVDFPDKRPFKKGKRGDQLFVSAKLNELWGLGNCYIGRVTTQSAGYVARYSLKKVNGDQSEEHYTYVDPNTGEISILQKEYLAASQGLGLEHYKKHAAQMYIRDSCIINGKEAPVPKYYDRKLGVDNPALLEHIKAKRVARAKLRKDDNTPARLAIREEIKQAQVTLLRRDLPDE